MTQRYMAQWYRDGFYKDRLNDFLGSNTVKLIFKSYFFCLFFFSCLLRKVLSNLFSIKCFTYYLFHKLILYFVLLILKHMFKSTCI